MGFKRLDPEDFLLSAESVTQTVWTGGSPTLNSFFTSSVQVNASISGDYYLTVYDKATTDVTSEDQFDIAYANANGDGALLYNDAVTNASPTQTIYGQYQTIILQDEDTTFTFGDYTAAANSDNDFYVISVERSRYKEKLLPGTLSLQLSGDGTNILLLTDNSLDVSLPTYYGTQRAYQIVRQGTTPGRGDQYGSQRGYTATRGSYGLFLPDIGVIMLNAAALDFSFSNPAVSADVGVSLGTLRTVDSDAENHKRLFSVINTGTSFTLNCEETITSNLVFIRARNSEFNYSENPSFTRGSTGEVYHNSFINQPQTFPTSVGLYNDSNELVAVAKLSRPLLKDFTKEALIRVKLDF